MPDWIAPGEVAMWNRTPFITSGYTGPLNTAFLELIESPGIQTLGVGPLTTFRQWGRHLDHVEGDWEPEKKRFSKQTKPWGLSNEDTYFDDQDRHTYPSASPERVEYFDVQRCVDVSADNITTRGVLYELTRFDVPDNSVGIIEQIPTDFAEITALDDGGVPIFTYGSLNGERVCLDGLAHPDPAVSPNLTWKFYITLSQLNTYTNERSAPIDYISAADPQHIDGRHLMPPYTDIRDGNRSIWGDKKQLIIPPLNRCRVWVALTGPQDRFRVRVGARLTGYWQSGGRRGAGLASVVARIV